MNYFSSIATIPAEKQLTDRQTEIFSANQDGEDAADGATYIFKPIFPLI
jgi:hypothetical protein